MLSGSRRVDVSKVQARWILLLYIVVYTDDLLVVHHEPKSIMDYLPMRYTLKPGSSMKEPDTYHGAQALSTFLIDGALATP